MTAFNTVGKGAMTALGVVIIIALIALVVLWPLAILFALNTLFPLLSIPYSFLTWLAVVILNISTFGKLSAAIYHRK